MACSDILYWNWLRTWQLQNIPGITLFLRNMKSTIIYAKFPSDFPLCNYTLHASDYKGVGNILEAILCKPFQLFWRIHNDVSSITKASFLQCRFQSREKVKSASSRWGEYGGWSSVVKFFAKKSKTNTGWCAGALSWRRNQLLVLHFWAHFLLTASLGR